jgi:hypothetical protein
MENKQTNKIDRYTYRGVNGVYYLYDRVASCTPANSKPKTKKEVLKEAEKLNKLPENQLKL